MCFIIDPDGKCAAGRVENFKQDCSAKGYRLSSEDCEKQGKVGDPAYQCGDRFKKCKCDTGVYKYTGEESDKAPYEYKVKCRDEYGEYYKYRICGSAYKYAESEDKSFLTGQASGAVVKKSAQSRTNGINIGNDRIPVLENDRFNNEIFAYAILACPSPKVVGGNSCKEEVMKGITRYDACLCDTNTYAYTTDFAKQSEAFINGSKCTDSKNTDHYTAPTCSGKCDSKGCWKQSCDSTSESMSTGDDKTAGTSGVTCHYCQKKTCEDYSTKGPNGYLVIDATKACNEALGFKNGGTYIPHSGLTCKKCVQVKKCSDVNSDYYERGMCPSGYKEGSTHTVAKFLDTGITYLSTGTMSGYYQDTCYECVEACPAGQYATKAECNGICILDNSTQCYKKAVCEDIKSIYSYSDEKDKFVKEIFTYIATDPVTALKSVTNPGMTIYTAKTYHGIRDDHSEGSGKSYATYTMKDNTTFTINAPETTKYRNDFKINGQSCYVAMKKGSCTRQMLYQTQDVITDVNVGTLYGYNLGWIDGKCTVVRYKEEYDSAWRGYNDIQNTHFSGRLATFNELEMLNRYLQSSYTKTSTQEALKKLNIEITNYTGDIQNLWNSTSNDKRTQCYWSLDKASDWNVSNRNLITYLFGNVTKRCENGARDDGIDCDSRGVYKPYDENMFGAFVCYPSATDTRYTFGGKEGTCQGSNNYSEYLTCSGTVTQHNTSIPVRARELYSSKYLRSGQNCEAFMKCKVINVSEVDASK